MELGSAVWIWNLNQWREGVIVDKKDRQMVVTLLETRQLIECETSDGNETEVRSSVELN